MPKSEEDRIREQINQGVWDRSSDELRRLKSNRYIKSETDGADLPEHIRKSARRGKIAGKVIGLIIILGFLYLAFRLGGALSALLRSAF